VNNHSPIVHVVDDDASYLVATARLLTAAGYTVRTFASADELLSTLGNSTGCVVTDLRMPGMDGLHLQQALLGGANTLPVIFLSGQGDIPETVRAMRQGAEDFLTKTAPKEQLFEAIDRAFTRDAAERAARLRRSELQARIGTLTPRELEVLRKVLEGKLNKLIAADLGITERTVKLHRTAIYSKLESRSVAELTRLAQAAGLIDQRPAHFPKG